MSSWPVAASQTFAVPSAAGIVALVERRGGEDPKQPDSAKANTVDIMMKCDFI